MTNIALVAHEPAALDHVGEVTDAVPPPPLLNRTRLRSRSHLLPVVVTVATLWWARAFLIPVVVSLLVSYALEPLVARLQVSRIPRAIAVPVVLGALVASLVGGVYALRGEAASFANRLPDAAHAVAQIMQGRASSTPGPWARLQQAVKELEAAANTARQARPIDGVTAVRIEEPTFKWNDWLWQGSHGAMAFAGQIFAVLCLSYYLLLSGDLFRRKLVRIVGPRLSSKKTTLQILSEIDRQIERFLMARAVISLVVGAAVWLTFRSLGIDEAGVWAVLAAGLFTIPIVGPAVVIAGAAVAGLLHSGSIGLAVAAAGLCTVIAALEGNVLQPLLMTRVGEMNAVAVFVSLLFWGWLWGAWGLLLAVPITASIKAVCERVDNLQPYAELLKA